MTGHKIENLTSGFRVVRANKFLYLLPNGFSYPTTSTMAFFRSGFPVAYKITRVRINLIHCARGKNGVKKILISYYLSTNQS